MHKSTSCIMWFLCITGRHCSFWMASAVVEWTWKYLFWWNNAFSWEHQQSLYWVCWTIGKKIIRINKGAGSIWYRITKTWIKDKSCIVMPRHTNSMPYRPLILDNKSEGPYIKWATSSVSHIHFTVLPGIVSIAIVHHILQPFMKLILRVSLCTIHSSHWQHHIACVRLNIKMCYRYRNPQFKDKMVLRPSYIQHGNPHTWKDGLYIETGPW